MSSAGVIQRSRSAFSSPIVIVRKKDGSNRFCVDYRQLNQQTQDEVSQLPLIAETLRDLGNATVFTSLDLKSGYWQVPVYPDSIPYTAFTTPDGASFEFLVMPFGLKCAPNTFQNLMVAVLAGYVDRFVKVYLDDIIIFSTSHEEHVEHLKLVLERLRTHGLRCSLDKCKFGADALDYLGHHVTAINNQPQERHVLRIREFPIPRTMKELQSFIGTANWLRDYVPEFAMLAAPLTDLIGKKRFRWTPEAEEAFYKLKDALSAPLELSRPDFNEIFYLATDACTVGMGAVLYQLGSQGERRIISCSSAKFSKTERAYHINEQEVLAVIYSIKKYKQYLEDRPFVLITDSKALKWLHQYKDDRAKLTRWALLLQEYAFTVIHRPGRENNLPDFLSRHPPAEEDPILREAVDEERLLPPDVGLVVTEPSPQLTTVRENRRRRCWHQSRRNSAIPRCFLQPTTVLNMAEVDQEGLEEEPLFDVVSRAQRDSVEYQATRVRWHRLQTGEEEATSAWQRTLRDDYLVEDNLIWHIKDGVRALVVPLEWWPRVMYEYHDAPHAGHPGRDETLRAIRQYYYWPTVNRQVKAYVKHCLICASTKKGMPQTGAPLRPHPPTTPWQTVSLDIMGPYPLTRNRNRFLLVLTDTFSKWVELKAVPHTRGNTLINFLNDICQRWGYPEAVITDNGRQFKSRAWGRYLQRNHITPYFTPVYHQRSNPVERRNQEIKKILRQQLLNKNENLWDQKLTLIMYNLHSRVNAATGQTPSRLLLGTDLVRPGGWHHPTARQPQPQDVVAERHRRVQQARARQTVFQGNLYPEPRQASQHFSVGDKVLIRSFPEVRTPFGPTWTGPHSVIAVSGDNVYEVDRNGSQERYHVDDLRPDPSLVPALAADADPLVLPLIDDGPAPRDEDVPDDVAGETASQVSDEPANPGLGRLCHPQHTADDGMSDAPDEPAFLGSGHPPYSPCPESSEIRSVVIEDVSDSEDDIDGCNTLGTPIVGLWP